MNIRQQEGVVPTLFGQPTREELLRANGHLELQTAEKSRKLRWASQRRVLDLAERLKAESALRESETQLRAIFENALDSVIVLDDDRNILEANESAQRLFGRNLEQLRGLRWDDLIPLQRLAGLEARWDEFLQGSTRRGELEVQRADGCWRLAAFSSRANIVPGRHLFTLRDITEHREAEDSLRLLSHRLMRLQDDERRRIARELHDSTGQALAALRMNLDMVRQGTPAIAEKAQKALDDAVRTCETCNSDIRTISYLLHPPLLDEIGLVPALDWYVSGFSERSGIRVTAEISELKVPLSKDLNTALFRIIQEALTNVHKHAECKQAGIRMYCAHDQLVLEIWDKGRGIGPQVIRQRRAGVQGLGVGITGMRERVRQLGGTLEIAAANPGTMVRAIFSLKEETHGNL